MHAKSDASGHAVLLTDNAWLTSTTQQSDRVLQAAIASRYVSVGLNMSHHICMCKYKHTKNTLLYTRM